MLLHDLIRLIDCLLNSCEDIAKLTLTPLRKCIPTGPFPEFLPELVKDLWKLVYLSWLEGNLLDLGEALSPERFLHYVLDTLYEVDFTLYVVSPLLQNVSLLTHEVILVHLIDYQLDRLLQSTVVHWLKFLDFLEFSLEFGLTWVELLSLVVEDKLYVF